MSQQTLEISRVKITRLLPLTDVGSHLTFGVGNKDYETALASEGALYISSGTINSKTPVVLGGDNTSQITFAKSLIPNSAGLTVGDQSNPIGEGTFKVLNVVEAGTLYPVIYKPAAPNYLGGIKLGYAVSNKSAGNYPVSVDDSTSAAYVNIGIKYDSTSDTYII